jgi:hypothetical protein
MSVNKKEKEKKMELVFEPCFGELTQSELISVDGGGLGAALGGFVGAVSIGLAPAVGLFCLPAGVGMALGGAGLLGKATNLY